MKGLAASPADTRAVSTVPGQASPSRAGTEWRAGARPLLAACLGLIGGTISIYVNNLFSPSLIREFGWSKAEFAMIGLTTAISVVALPIAGRLADRYGMRRVALAGVIGLPLVFLGLALQTGSFALFFLLSTFQMLTVSSLAGIVVYGRIVVAFFERGRGLALGIASCAPALATMVTGPALSGLIDSHSWRVGYVAMAAASALFGGLALLLVPRTFRDAAPPEAPVRRAAEDYREILASRAFKVIFAAMLLCNVHFTLQTTQLTLIVTEGGVSSQAAGTMLSLFALGVIAGRIACGLALDHFPARLVAAACFLLPACGLAILSTGPSSTLAAGMAVCTLGFSVGAEGDIAAYLATRYFRPALFSSVLGLFTSAMATSALCGAFLVNRILAQTGSYGPFLAISAGCVFCGCLLFLLLSREAPQLRAKPGLA